MAIKLSEVNGVSNSTNLKYVADEESEKNNIPAEDKIQGTEVLVIESGKTYKMNSNGEWILKSGSGGGGGSSLPAVTAADNGDVLTVVNGAWDKETPSGTLDFDTYAVELAPSSTMNVFNVTLYNLKSGEACGTSVASIEMDGETGDLRVVLDDTTSWDIPAVLMYELRNRIEWFDAESLEANYTAGLTFGIYV